MVLFIFYLKQPRKLTQATILHGDELIILNLIRY